jgi:hypothetical protein
MGKQHDSNAGMFISENPDLLAGIRFSVLTTWLGTDDRNVFSTPEMGRKFSLKKVSF